MTMEVVNDGLCLNCKETRRRLDGFTEGTELVICGCGLKVEEAICQPEYDELGHGDA